MLEIHERQKAYAAEQPADSATSLIAPAFIRGIRDLGYKDNAKAINELVDNANEAGATRVDIVFGYADPKKKSKPNAIAVIDDGIGMPSEMIQHALRFGGTDREGSTEGWGRFGFGLPASCVSLGTKYEVYSKIDGEHIYMSYVDVNWIGRAGASFKIPDAVISGLPQFVEEALEGREFNHGTVVVISNLDRLSFKTTSAFVGKLLIPNLAVTYNAVRQGFDIFVDGTLVEPVDPLFLRETHKYYDTNGLTAQAFESMIIDVKSKDEKGNTGDIKGQIRIRFSYFDPQFALNDISGANNPDNRGPRWPIIQEHTGLIVSRQGRIIDVLKRTPQTRFVNNDAFIKIELDFDATLDSEFGVTTSKQQIVVSERIWEILKTNGFFGSITSLRSAFKKLKFKKLEEKQKEAERLSAKVMEKTTKFKRKTSEAVKARQKKEGEENLRKKAERVANETGRDKNVVENELRGKRKGRYFDVEHSHNTGGRFFSVRMEGGTKVLQINQAHRFYTDLYRGPNSDERSRASLELLLLAIGDAMEDATDEVRRMYHVELQSWSEKLHLALDYLAEEDDPEDTLDIDEELESVNND